MDNKPAKGQHPNRRDRTQTDAQEDETSLELRKTLHDLQVHQIELEMQNQELRRTQQSLEETTNRFSQLYDFAPMGYVSLNDDGLIVDLNLTGAGVLKYPRAEIVGRPFAALLAPGQTNAFFSHLRQVFRQSTSTPLTSELQVMGGDGHSRLLSLYSTPMKERSSPVCLTAFTDVSEHRLAQEKLRQAAKAFDSTLEAIVITNAHLEITAVNSAFSRITGYTEEDVCGQHPRALGLIRPGADEESEEILWTTLRRYSQWQGEASCRRRDQQTFPIWGTISAVAEPGKIPVSYVLVFSDITPLKQAQKRLVHLANHDTLTGLPNRLHFEAKLTQALAIAKRHAKRVAMLYLDLDHFKNINDTMGHACGDLLLKTVAERLRRFIRSEDLVCRLGGDEFVVVFNDIAQPREAATLAEKLLGLLNRPVRLNGSEVTTGASIGISLFEGRPGIV